MTGREAIKRPACACAPALRELASSVRSLPAPMFGFVLVSIWQVWLNVSDIPAKSASPVSDSLSFLATLIAIAAIFMARPQTRLRPGVVVIACCLGAASAVGVATGRDPVLVGACVLVSGAVKAIVNVGWCVLYTRLHMRQAFVCVLLTYMIDRALNGVMFFLPGPVQAVIAPTCLVVSGALFHRASRQLGDPTAEASENARAHRHTLSALLKFAVCLFAFNLAVVALLRIAPQTHGMTEEILMHAAEMLLAAVLLLAGAVMRRPVRFALLWGCAFVMITSALLSVCLGLEALTLTLTKMSTGFLAIVIWLVAIDFAHHGRMSPVAIVAVLRAAAGVPSVALYLLQPLLPSAWNAPAVAATLMWLLSIATLYFVTERELIALRLFEGLDAVAPVQPGVADIEHRCAEIAARFGLTERERQIMAMTCLGKSKAYIAGQIGISESTVKSHVRNIYAKLDVHSKNELQGLVGL